MASLGAPEQIFGQMMLTVAGAPFQWAAIFHKEDINFVNGSESLEWYVSDSWL